MEHKEACCICLDSWKVGVQWCNEGHWNCEDCFPLYVKSCYENGAKFTDQGFMIHCPVPSCKSTPFTVAELRSNLPASTMNSLHEAMIHYCSIKSASALTNSVKALLTEALNLHCPNCNVILDPNPDGCCAMRCTGCGVHFCWLCFEVLPNSTKCHDHVRSCQMNSSCKLFAPTSVVQSAHKLLRIKQLQTVLKEQHGTLKWRDNQQTGHLLQESFEALKMNDLTPALVLNTYLGNEKPSKQVAASGAVRQAPPATPVAVAPAAPAVPAAAPVRQAPPVAPVAVAPTAPAVPAAAPVRQAPPVAPATVAPNPNKLSHWFRSLAPTITIALLVCCYVVYVVLELSSNWPTLNDSISLRSLNVWNLMLALGSLSGALKLKNDGVIDRVKAMVTKLTMIRVAVNTVLCHWPSVGAAATNLELASQLIWLNIFSIGCIGAALTCNLLRVEYIKHALVTILLITSMLMVVVSLVLNASYLMWRIAFFLWTVWLSSLTVNCLLLAFGCFLATILLTSLPDNTVSTTCLNIASLLVRAVGMGSIIWLSVNSCLELWTWSGISIKLD